MTRHLSLLLAVLFHAAAVAQEVTPSALVLKMTDTPATPALIGTLGNPDVGQNVSAGSFHWFPGDHLLTVNRHHVLQPLELWKRDPQYPRLLYRGMLNVGGVWAVSTRGTVLCGQSERGLDNAGPQYLSDLPGTLSCFRWSDASTLWSIPFSQEEDLVDIGFSQDDKVLVAIFNRDSQIIVSLRDPATGKEMRRQGLPGAEAYNGNSSGSGRFAVRLRDFLIARPINGEIKLMRVPFDTLQPEIIATPPFNSIFNTITASPDGRYLAMITGMYEGPDRKLYAVLEDKKTSWTAVISGQSEEGLINGVIFSPDSRQVVVAASDDTRVFNLASRKMVASLGPKCNEGAFSPDGAIFAGMQHSHAATWTTRDWKLITQPEPPPQHQCPVKGVQFLADGKTIATWDHNGVILWDIATRIPRAELRPRNAKRACIESFENIAIANQGTEIIAGDSWDYLRWKLPSLNGPPPKKPAIVLSDKAFPGPPNTATEGQIMRVFADPEGRRIFTIDQLSGAVHDLQKPTVVTTFKVAPQLPLHTLATFAPDGKSLFYVNSFAEPGWKRVDLVNGAIASLPAAKFAFQNAVAYLPKSDTALYYTGDSLAIVEFHTGKVLKKFRCPQAHGNGLAIAAVSPDEQHIAGCFQVDKHFSLVLWEKDSGSLVAVQRLPSDEVTSLAFSPDGKMLASGHHNSSIALWDVEKLIQTSKPSDLVQEASPQPRVVSMPFAAGASADLTVAEIAVKMKELQQPVLPATEQKGHDDEVWSFLPGGALSRDKSMPSAGSLTVGNAAFVSQAVRYHPERNHPMSRGGMDEGRCIVANEGPALNGSLWVSRQLGEPAGQSTSWMVFTDTFTNVSPAPISTTVEFETQFPATVTDFVDSNFQKITPAADGTLPLDLSIQWIAPITPANGGEPLPMLVYQSPSADKPASVSWNAATHVIRVRHELAIRPGEKRFTAHSMKLIPRDPQQLPGVFKKPYLADFSAYLLPATRERGINFGKLEREPGPTNPPVKMPAHPLDRMGFEWTELDDFARQGQLGALSVFQLWIDGHPLPFAGAALFPPSFEGAGVIYQRSPVRGQTLDGKVVVVRYLVEPGPNATLSIWNDLFINTSDAPVDIKVSLMTSFAASPVELWDAQGKQHPLDRKDMDAADLSGACALVVPGDQKPATVLIFYRDGSAIAPRLHWTGDRMVAVDYTLSIPAKGSIVLRHGACQRPFAAFPSPADAIADCLPLVQRPESFYPRTTKNPPPSNYRE